ncbi:Ribosome biogenesis protein Nop53/GLTSCR2 [Trypanosoma melophagium]|uniref:Ribosome biogenesis protein Nop53/GLTSCR2 n=1 Tax=Trypanosoma melophagium TaxID=715481 RepID=UPI00351A012A|nr:Ribosome biogenesis protein Nop53/GLTSCR2 [Trypanosoma melophagium]
MGGRVRDLWFGAEERAVGGPRAVAVGPGWSVRPEVLPQRRAGVRRRKYAPVRPNQREAVALPHPGQSYNPCDDDHQQALRTVVKQLERKKKADEKFVAMITQGRDMEITGNFSADKTWEEEVQEQPTREKQKRAAEKKKKLSSPSTVITTANGSNCSTNKTTTVNSADVTLVVDEENKTLDDVTSKNKKKDKKKDKKKKKNKTATKASLQATRRALPHRRHPKREVAIAEVDELDDILATNAKNQARRDAARERRREAKRANLQVKSFGRYHHTPLALDVVPTDKLVESLRHLNGSYVHPVMERMKSLEERNLVPARMRHKYNKRKILKPKGEVRVKRETFGVLPETSF